MADYFQDSDPDQGVDPTKDYLSEYVGDGKKFRDTKELARAKAEADAHIARVEAENQAFRERLQQTKSIEELMTELDERANRRPEGNNHVPEPAPAPADNGISADDLDRLLEEKLTKRQKEDRAKTNETWVMQQLTSKFGQNYGERVRAAAAELGLSKEDVTTLAREKPKAFLKLVDDNQPQDQRGNFSPPSNRVNTQADGPSGARNYKFYSNIRKTDPKTYQSGRVQQEMHREAIKQGAAFYD